jgi:hypothetical protein
VGALANEECGYFLIWTAQVFSVVDTIKLLSWTWWLGRAKSSSDLSSLRMASGTIALLR